MNFELRPNDSESFLEVIFSGVIDVSEAYDQLPGIFNYANERKFNSILFDMTQSILNESIEESFSLLSEFSSLGLDDNTKLIILFDQDVVKMHFLKTYSSVKNLKNIYFFNDCFFSN